MRKWILSFCCLALATPAWAQSTTIVHDASLLPVNHVSRSGACCNDACPQKSCVAVPAIITHHKTVFASKCIEYCTPKCSLQRGCDSCADNCGKVRTKHVLMKKVITTECPGTKCEPAYVADTARFLATLREEPVEALAEATSANFHRLFAKAAA